MIHTHLALIVPALLLALAPRSVSADDLPPCTKEAEVVKAMKPRDPSLTQPSDATTKAHLEQGKRAFGVGQYDQAIDSYTAAGLLSDSPLILYNLGQTYRALKDYEKAIRQYNLFVERGRPGTEVRALVECQVATMTAEMEHAASTAPPTGPAPDPVETEPSDEASGTATKADNRWTNTRKASLGVGVAGVAVLAAGVVLGIQSRGYRNDAESVCPTDPCGRADEANALSDKAGSRATLANVSYGIGAAMIAGAAVLWYLGAPSTSPRADHAAIIPTVAPGFAGVALSTRF